jgi:hypothetical protein
LQCTEPTGFLDPRSGSPAQATEKGRLARLLVVFFTLQTLLIAACFATEQFCHSFLHLGPPYDYVLKARDQDQFDFRGYWGSFQHFHSQLFFSSGAPFLYPAPVALAYWPFFAHPYHQRTAFLSFICSCFIVGAFVLWRALVQRGAPKLQTAAILAAALACAYPVWFDLKQGNIEIAVWVIVALGVWAFVKGRGYSAAVCFGIAGSMKIFPIVYLGLLLSSRKYREIAVATVVLVVTTVASLWIVSPGIRGTWHLIGDGLDQFRTVFMLHLRLDETAFDHSLWGFYKHVAPHLPPIDVLGRRLNLYLAAAALTGVSIYFFRIRYMPLINQVLCLTVASILLPPTSYDYTLMHLYIPFALLALYAQDRAQSPNPIPGLTSAFACLAILVSPETEFIYHGIGFAGQIKAIVLIALFGIGLRYPFADRATPPRQAQSASAL